MHSEFDYEIIKLSADFYKAYNHKKYPEILLKHGRSYNCLLIESHYGYYICIPYRTNIHHNNAFLFKNTSRSKQFHSGLDYTKIIIVNNKNYLESKSSIIDKDEFLKTKRYIHSIKNGALLYVDRYVAHCNGTSVLNKKEFDRNYGMSTLQYFHKELDI